MAKLSDLGTAIYGVDPAQSPSVFTLGCISAIDGLSGPAQQVDVTCFSSVEMEYEAGRANPGQITVSGIYDTNDSVFTDLVELKNSKRKIEWYIGGSDGTDPPTEDTDGGVLPPTTRTGLSFAGYVADITWQIQQNNVWRYQLMIQRSGPWTLTQKTP